MKVCKFLIGVLLLGAVFLGGILSTRPAHFTGSVTHSQRIANGGSTGGGKSGGGGYNA